MKYRVVYEYRDNDCYHIVEADSVKQARGRFALREAKLNDMSFIKAIRMIKKVEEIKE